MSGLNQYFEKNKRKASKQDAQDGNRCVICMVDFDEATDDQVVEVACPAKHLFHVECIKEWIKTKAQCPSCRANILV